MSKIDSNKLVSAGRNIKNAIYTTIATSIICFGIMYGTSKNHGSAGDSILFIGAFALIGGCISLYLWISAANDLINCEVPYYEE